MKKHKRKKDDKGWFRDQFDGWVREPTMDERPAFIKAKACCIIRVYKECEEHNYCGDAPNMRWEKGEEGHGQLVPEPKFGGLCEGHYTMLHGEVDSTQPSLEIYNKHTKLDKAALIASMKENRA